MSRSEIVLSMQPGRQQQAGACAADIVGFGGAAGGGKTEWLLKNAVRHYNVNRYVAKIFRRVFPQIAGGGGMWDRTHDIYPYLGGKANHSDLIYTFPNYGSSVGFSHLQHEKDKLNHQGKEYAFIGVDEADQMEWSQIWYLWTRNRTTCGVRPLMNWTFNPNPDHEIKPFISWWLDEKGQFPDLSKAGVIRWFVRRQDGSVLWDNQDVDEFFSYIRDMRKYVDPGFRPTSFSFIPASIDDNPAILEKDPSYKSKLLASPLIERQRLLYGDWLIRESAGNFFKRQWFNFRPHTNNLDIVKIARYWDRAATEAKKGNDPDYTAGCLMARLRNGQYIVLDMVRFRGSPLEVENRIIATAKADAEAWGNVEIGIEQDPGQAGKFEGAYYTRALAGFVVKLHPAKQSKVKRAEPVSAQCEAGNVIMLQAPWNEALISELEAFPEGGHDDQVDALSGAFSVVGINKDNFSGWV